MWSGFSCNGVGESMRLSRFLGAKSKQPKNPTTGILSPHSLFQHPKKKKKKGRRID